MSISQLRLSTTNNAQIDRGLNQISDKLNEIIDSVNQRDVSDVKSLTRGKPGDIRLSLDSTDGNYYIDGRTDEGWVRSSAMTIIER